MGLGDDLMWLGEAAEVYKEHKDVVIHDGTEYSVMWKGHDWIVPPDYTGPKKKMLVPRKPNGNRWYIKGWESTRIVWKNYQPKPAPYKILDSELKVAESVLEANGIQPGDPFVILNPDTKNTTLSTNKDWGIDNWQTLTNLLYKRIKVVRVKPAGPIQDRSGHVDYNQKLLDNAVNIMQDDVRISFAIMSLSKLIVTGEGGVHHFAAAINKPAFVIYGGPATPDQTGYTGRNQTYYVYDDPKTPCGSRVPCNHCKEAMAAIKPHLIYMDVLEELDGI